MALNLPKKPKQNFWDKVRDVVDANTPMDNYKRAQATPTPFRVPTNYEDEQKMRGNKRPNQNIGQAVLGNTLRVLNTGIKFQTDTMPRLGASLVLKGANRTGLISNNRYNTAVNSLLDDKKVYGGYGSKGGIFNAGTVIDSPEEAKNLTFKDVAKKSVAYGAGTYGELSPVKAPGKGLLKRTGFGATEAVIGDAGSQLANTGRIDPRQSAQSALFGGAMANTGPVTTKLVSGGKKVADKSAKVAAKMAQEDADLTLISAYRRDRGKIVNDTDYAQRLDALRRFGIDPTKPESWTQIDRTLATRGEYIKNPLARDAPQVGKTPQVGTRVSYYTSVGEKTGTITKVPDTTKDPRIKGNSYKIKFDEPVQIGMQKPIKETYIDWELGQDGLKILDKPTPPAQVGKTDPKFERDINTGKMKMVSEPKPTVKTEKYSIANSDISRTISTGMNQDGFTVEDWGGKKRFVSLDGASTVTKVKVRKAEAEYEAAKKANNGTALAAKQRVNDAYSDAIQDLKLQDYATTESGGRTFNSRYNDWLETKYKDRNIDTATIKDMAANPQKYRSQFEAETSTAPQVGKTLPKVKQVAQGKPPITLPEKPKVNLKSSVDPTDPFGNRSILKRLKNEMGNLVDNDSQMISMLKKIEKDTGRKGLVDQWYFDTGNIKASNAIANAKIRQSGDLGDAFSGLSKKDLSDFDAYTAARAELKNYSPDMKVSKSRKELAKIVSDGNARFGQRFQAMNQYYKQLAQDMYDGGLIDEARLKMYQESDDYVRIQRDMEDLVGFKGGSSDSRSIGTTKANQKRTGSKRDVLSPSESLLKRTQEIQKEIQRNKAATNLIDVLVEAGLAKPLRQGTNKNTIKRMVNGVNEIYEVHPEIKEVVENVKPYQLGVLARIVSAPVRLFRAGTTALSAPFTVTNYLRDQASSALYSKEVLATHNPKNIISGLANATSDQFGGKTNPLWKKFEMYAGDQTVFDELRNQANSRAVLRELRQGNKGKLINAVNPASWVRTLEDFNGITEKATRFQNFSGTYEKAIQEGLSEAQATQKAVLAARQNSVDFSRGSDFTRTLNLFLPYFNASVQGTRNVVRSFKERPLATSMKSIGFVAMPSIAVTMWNLSDEDRRKAYDSINDWEKEDNFIIIGPDAKQQDNGTWTGIYKIPKPQGYRELTDPVRDVTEAFMKGESPQSVADMLHGMLGGLTGPVNIEDGSKFLGSLTPQQAKPFVQFGMNKDLYTGAPIVPEMMIEQTDDPTKRARKSTSGSARIIANKLGISPIQVERLITDQAGSLGRYGINAADNVLNKLGMIPEEQIGGRSIKSDFSRRLFEATGQLLEENKTSGQKYYDSVKEATKGLNKNDKAAWDTLNPVKTNFLGEDIFDENKRIAKYTKAGIYLNNPNVLEAARKLNELQVSKGNPSNPLFELPTPLLTKVLLKDALPPGAKDPELSNLYKEEWYQDYQNARGKYYEQVKANMAAQGKEMPQTTNPYPTTPEPLQQAMDAYSALPKGTGERSAWIRNNPGLWAQMTAQWAQVDAWENKERVAIGLGEIVDEQTSQGSNGGYGGYSGQGGSGGSKGPTKSYLKGPKQVATVKGKITLQSNKPKVKKFAVAKPKVSIRKSQV